MKVFHTDSGNESSRKIFHRETCHKLSISEKTNVVEADLSDLVGYRPCYMCFPDTPRAKYFRQFCPECNSAKPYPCPHNGGVLITRYRTLNRKNAGGSDKPYPVRYWVWPDAVQRYSA